MGMAKDIPEVTFILLMPIASPSKLTSGPPLLPNVIGASVCMYTMSLPEIVIWMLINNYPTKIINAKVCRSVCYLLMPKL